MSDPEILPPLGASPKQRKLLVVVDDTPECNVALLYAAKAVERGATPAGGDELGDRLLALVAEAAADGVDPEQALRDAVRRAR